jgi:hypothetical protein
MAAEVFGSIVGANGVEDITLNNAATEATLKQLLTSSMGANKQTLDTLKDLAKSAGLDPDIAARAEKNIDKLGAGAGDLDGDFGTLQQSSKKVDINFRSMMASTGQLIEGTATLGGLLNTLGGVLPGKLGFLVEMLGKAADFQDKSLQAYQQISGAGVSLAGDLIGIRISAMSMGLTLAEFSNLIKSNGSALASLGGTTDSGTKSFIKFSSALINSDTGRKLMEMGYSFEQINAVSLDYLQMSGGRKKSELESAAAINQNKEAVLGYMTELDKLAKITGKSREALNDQIKQLSLDPAWQSFTSNLDPKSQEAMNVALAESTRLGKSSAQNFQASALGFSVWNKETAVVAGIMSNSYAYSAEMQRVATDKNLSAEERKAKIQELGSRQQFAAYEAAKNAEKTLQVITARGGQAGEAAREALSVLAQTRRNEITTIEQQIAFDKKAMEASKAPTDQQVKDATAVALAMKNLGTEILALMKGPLEAVSPVLKIFAENIGKISILLLGLGGILALYKAYTLGQNVRAAPIGEKMTTLFGGWGKSPTNALWVRVVPGGGSLSAPDLPGGGKGKEPEGKGGKAAGSLKGGLGGVVAGLTLGVASDIATNSGMEKTGAGLDIASQAAAFAGTGALLGSIVPFVGTALGAGIGGVLGAGLGLYQNSGALFGSSPNIDKSSEVTPTTETKLSQEQTSLVASYQKRSAENSDRMLLIMRELTEITREHRDIVKIRPPTEAPRTGHNFGNVPVR